MRNWRGKPYCCTHDEWINANYGVRMDGVPFIACKNEEHAWRVYNILKERHPGVQWTVSVKTKGVY